MSWLSDAWNWAGDAASSVVNAVTGGGGGGAGAVPGQRADRDVGRAGERPRLRGRGPGRYPGRAVQPQRGEVGGDR